MALHRVLLPSSVTAPEAASQQLAFVNLAGNAIMKVDNTTNLAFAQKRNTVRIATKDQFAVGSVWIADMLHIPFGVRLSCHLQWWWLCQWCRVAHMAPRSTQKKEISKGSHRRVPRGGGFQPLAGSIFCIMPILTTRMWGPLHV